ncbi:hypothetical protein [Planctomicrobium piriforme]|uniref:Uncharacterized protein n=1 Tax=Planctomicrobium piriforme TaxID=1576369 RepID=A0A1I3HEH0_9PLAN|nr:hypothetical protein [Planctomicrobium piriforme]SFI33980.1 hypothetical protein SAMN05421753_10824 [Planctomicrobium piriforme]
MLRSIQNLLKRSPVCRAAACCAIFSFADAAHAQITRGFDRTAPAAATATELAHQPDYWAMEVQMKPIRLVWVDEVNPTTGEKTRQQIWYLAWRAIVRPIAAPEAPDIAPINQLDPLPGPRQFIPEMTLVTYDDPAKEVPAQILHDEIMPAAMQQIRQVERDNYLDMVAVVQDLPEPTPADAEQQQWIYGAATWKGVDPETDFFKVILGGFTNGYEVKKNDAEEQQVWRKVIVQRYSRLGDRFDPANREFNYVGKPEWAFQPDAGGATTEDAQ